MARIVSVGLRPLTAQTNNNPASPPQKRGRISNQIWFSSSKTCIVWKLLPPWLTESAVVKKMKEAWLKSKFVFFFLQRGKKTTQVQLSEPSPGKPSKSTQGPINLHQSSSSVMRSRLLKVLNISWIKTAPHCKPHVNHWPNRCLLCCSFFFCKDSDFIYLHYVFKFSASLQVAVLL